CLELQENSWMIDAYKTFDAPSKAIHTCHPFALGFKREYLNGGKKFIANSKNKKSQVFERFRNYFDRAIGLISNKDDKILQKPAKEFSTFFINGSWEIILNDILNQRDAKYHLLESKEENLKEKLRATKDRDEQRLIKEDLKNLTIDMLEYQPLANSDYVIFYLD